MGEQKMDHIRLNGSFVSGMKELKEHKEVISMPTGNFNRDRMVPIWPAKI